MHSPFLACLLLISISVGARSSQDPAPSPPIPPGTKIDPSSDFFKYWPAQGQPGLFKIKDNLVLAVPPQYQQYWIWKERIPRAPMPLDKIPVIDSIGFQFFLPKFGGYTPTNYNVDFDENRVDVTKVAAGDMKEAALGAPGYYPPNVLERLIRHYPLDPQIYRDMYGLRCYGARHPRSIVTAKQTRDLMNTLCLRSTFLLIVRT
jgi:hypothetical protein